MLHNHLIKKEDIDNIFDSFSSVYKKLGGKEELNIYLVGGAAIVLNFSYRAATIDIDAFYKDSEIINKAIKETSTLLDLPIDWLNHDFVNTPSFSELILDKSHLYKNYFNIINVFVLDSKYLIAMKLKSSRPTGGDLDDIIKMIYELRYKNDPIKYEDIINAYTELYPDFSNTYDYFLEKAKEAFEIPVEDFDYLFK